ncbi:MAG: glycosyltransferase [bacterium]
MNKVDYRKTAIIICTKDRLQDLKEYLDSIFIQTVLPNELIIVDSSKNNKTKSFINQIEYEVPFKIQYVHTVPCLTLQRNIGIKTTEAEIIHFMDDDVILERDYLEEINRIYSDDKKNDIGGVFGLLTNIQNSSFFAKFIRRLFMLSRSDGFGNMQPSGFQAFQFITNRSTVAETEVFCGICSYRKEVFNNFQFDENMKGYGLMEDIDFSYRVSRKYKLIYTPYAKVFHKSSPVSRINSRQFCFMKTYNHYYFFMKNIEKTSKTWFCFWWSTIGVFIESIVMAIKFFSFNPIYGFAKGIFKIVLQK